MLLNIFITIKYRADGHGACDWGWRIQDFTSIVPLANQVGAHVLLPLLLAVFWLGVEGSYKCEKTRVMGGL